MLSRNREREWNPEDSPFISLEKPWRCTRSWAGGGKVSFFLE
jgi:hypothetical protein